MEKELLLETIEKLMGPKKGILAADESTESAGKRLAMVGLENTAENRQKMRDIFFSAPEIEHYISGVILFDETMRQNSRDGTPFTELLIDKGITPGIKVDAGREPLPEFPGEDVTEGLDGLRDRLVEYVAMGARFAKWRALFQVTDALPSEGVVEANVDRMAQYAAMCQAENLVPIVEPEVLMKGAHSMDRAETVTINVLKALFEHLRKMKVDLPTAILKTSMVLPGTQSQDKKSPEEIAEATVRTLKMCVPEQVGGVVFLSGGQEPDEAAQNLNAIAKHEPLPWQITFSFSRALEYPALEVWQGRDENIPAAQEAFVKQLHIDMLADQGKLLPGDL